jgi:XTP/dITP diphosphohydrolase
MKLVFATNNLHKIREAGKIVPAFVQLIKLKDIGCTEELPETGNTLSSNARQKARYIHDKYGVDCFADDSGLEVEALGGRPGVYSARFAGPEADAARNNEKLLTEMKGVVSRNASFRTVIVLYLSGKEYLFEGAVPGKITEQPRGENGFGYDPVFIPEVSEKTFAEMNEEEKNACSHRARALHKLSEFLAAKK